MHEISQAETEIPEGSNGYVLLFEDKSHMKTRMRN